jgi:3-oxoacyl-[acyl-carrier protein] reductase
VEERFGKIDVLINAFGVTHDRSLAFMSDEEWNSVISINLNGLYYFTRAAIIGMIKRRSGSIINFSSVSGISGMPGQTNYAASKAAIIGFSKSLAKEVSPRGVRVNVIAPGFIETAMTDGLLPEYVEKMRKNIPLGRIGKVEDLLGIARLLASDESSYITGQVFVVDGGMAI